ncbi:MAG: GNAT family N-acetyltransferase [Bacteroidales bacterium]|nr:GNAT family N-acetyltransferase [Bacteroidales bacterium]
MEIRKGKREDAKQIISFQQKMAKETEDLELSTEILHAGVNAVFDDESKGTYYVAEDKGKVIASLMTTYEWSDWRNGCVLWIQSVYVLPEYRKKGVYKQMYEYLKNKVKNSDKYMGLRLYVDLSNKPAQKVYTKLGMNGEHYKLFEWFK